MHGLSTAKYLVNDTKLDKSFSKHALHWAPDAGVWLVR